MTPRQVEMLRLRALGLTNAAAAAELGISEQHFKNLLADVYRMFDAACLEDALRAVGWLQVPHTSAGLRAVRATEAAATDLVAAPPARREQAA